VNETSEILRIEEVAKDLRCSRAHVYNAINGKVRDVSRLPVICIGRRRLVRRTALEAWKQVNERNAILAASPEVDSRGRMKGDHA
jgi:excisionase family DNA binding protein